MLIIREKGFPVKPVPAGVIRAGTKAAVCQLWLTSMYGYDILLTVLALAKTQRGPSAEFILSEVEGFRRQPFDFAQDTTLRQMQQAWPGARGVTLTVA